MRFAFKTAPRDTSWDALLAVWRAADEIEIFESGWTSDHVRARNPSDSRLDGWITMTALAQATRRLRLGTLVTGIHFRHPAILAGMAATLDLVSHGRLELGIGAGWNEAEAGAYGIALGTPAQRSDRLEEACEVLIRLLSATEPVTFSGQYYQLEDARCDARPVQRPLPPICIGGSGEKRTLRTAAKYARHWNFAEGTPAEFSRSREVLERHCLDVGRNPAEILTSAQVNHYGDPADTAARAASLGAAGAGLAIICLQPPYSPADLLPLARALDDAG